MNPFAMLRRSVEVAPPSYNGTLDIPTHRRIALIAGTSTRIELATVLGNAYRSRFVTVKNAGASVVHYVCSTLYGLTVTEAGATAAASVAGWPLLAGESETFLASGHYIHALSPAGGVLWIKLG